MGTLYLVRHGQASFGSDNYDRLSALGHRQSERLGDYFAQRGLRFDAVILGTLQRHEETLQGIARGMQMGSTVLDAALRKPGLNEYDSEAVIHTVHPQPLARPDTPELYRQHFRLLRDGLRQWMDGVVSPRGMPSYDGFVRGIVDVLDHVRASHHGANVLVVSSGGPISTAVGQVLGTPAETTIELNLRMRNTSVTEFAFTPKRHMLVTYNTLPHLDNAEHRDWVTYA